MLIELCSPLPTTCCQRRRGKCVIKRHDVSPENFHTVFKTLVAITRTSHCLTDISLLEGFTQIQYRHISEFCFVAPREGWGGYLSFFFPPGRSTVWCHLASLLVGPDSAADASETCEYLQRVTLGVQNVWLGHMSDASS